MFFLCLFFSLPAHKSKKQIETQQLKNMNTPRNLGLLAEETTHFFFLSPFIFKPQKQSHLQTFNTASSPCCDSLLSSSSP